MVLLSKPEAENMRSMNIYPSMWEKYGVTAVE
jgi:hypothetical protein